METDYNLNSDSDDDEDNIPQMNQSVNRNKSLGNHIHDIEKLKVKAHELLDPTWKEIRNRNLLHKMFELEELTISPKVRLSTDNNYMVSSCINFVDGRFFNPRWCHGDVAAVYCTAWQPFAKTNAFRP